MRGWFIGDRRLRDPALPLAAQGASVPRYFFHVLDRSAEPDRDGSEFPDIYAAQEAAVRLCGELIREMDGRFWEEPTWRLQVTSHDNEPLLTFTFSVEEHDPNLKN